MRIVTTFIILAIFAALPGRAWATPPHLLRDGGHHVDRVRGAPAPAVLPTVGSGEAESSGSEWPLGWLDRERLTGDWAGLRTTLEDLGVTFEATYVLDWSKPFSSGIRHRDTARSLLDFNLAFDLERILGLSGGTFFLDAYAQWGRNGSDDTGEFHGYSNIDSDDRTQLSEVWYEQYLFGERLRFKLGKVDANSEFAFVDAAGDFIDSAAGFSPTIPLPTYPDPAMSVILFAYPTESLYAGVAVFDGAGGVDGVPTGRRGPETFFSNSKSDDYFVIGEVGWLWNQALSGGAGRLAVGSWVHTGTFDRWDGGTQNDSAGWFALIEHQVWRENPANDSDEQGLTLFAQYGYADEDVSEAVHHLGFGGVWGGGIPGRDDDALGLMVSWIDLSDKEGAGFAGNETVLELFYLFQLTPFLGVKTDLQYVANPSGDRNATDIVVGTLRIEAAF